MPMRIAVPDDHPRQVGTRGLKHVELRMACPPERRMRGNRHARPTLRLRGALEHSPLVLA